MADIPNSYKDDYWSNLANNAGNKAGLPTGLLASIVNDGERSNNNQVSEAGARSPFQIIPSTRKAILDKYGIDPYLNPENAAEGAALLLKESLGRNQGDTASAIAEYHGGTNRDNWGRKTSSYVNRVINGLQNRQIESISDDFGNWLKANPAEAPAIQGTSSSVGQPDKQLGVPADTSAVSSDFGNWLKQQKEQKPQEEPGVLDRLTDVVTGNLRATPTTRSLPEWTGMPELNDFSVSGAKTGLGTILAQPDEIVQIIKANYPNTQVRQDEKGNYVIRSSIDGKEYAIKPGFTLGDIPRAAAGLLAFAPAAGVPGIVGGGLAAAATQAAIEGTQAATGGSFDPADIAITGAIAGAVPPLMSGIKAVSGAIAEPIQAGLSKLRGVSSVAKEVAAQPEVAGAQTVKAMPGNEPMAVEKTAITPSAPIKPASSILEQTPPKTQDIPQSELTQGQPMATQPLETGAMSREPVSNEPLMDLRQSAKTAGKAAEGGRGSEDALDGLVNQISAEPKIYDAARRLGIEEHLQPDHVSTNQVYRELSQAVKSVTGSVAHAEEVKGLEQVAKRADNLISELGGSDDLSAINQRVKKGLEETQSELDSKAEKLYSTIKLAISPKEKVNPSAILAFIKQRSEDLGGTKNISPLENLVLNKLKVANIYGSSPLLTGERAVTGTIQPNYALVDSVRKTIGRAARSQGPFKDEDTGLAKKLYGLISDDMEGVAAKNGFGNDFYQAKTAVRLRKGIEDDLTSLFGKNIDGSIVGDIGRSVGNLSKGDTSQFIQLIKAVPEDLRQQVVASGLNTAFGKSARQGTINFNSYAKWYEGLLKNKQAYHAIMANLPSQARKQLSDLYRVSNGISKSSRERIKTGAIQMAKEVIESSPGESLAARMYQAAKRQSTAIAAGGIGSFIHPSLGVVLTSALSKGPKTPAIIAVDKLLVSPEFKKAVMRSLNGEAKKAAHELSKSKVFSNFVLRAFKPGEMTNRERWILQSLEANSTNRSQPTPVQQAKAS